MRVAAVALADEAQRFASGYPPKGARLFLWPDVEIQRLAALLGPEDELQYVDERVESVELRECDLCLLRVDLGQEDRARRLLGDWATNAATPVLFGPSVTSWRTTPPSWCTHRVVGDIANVWSQLRADAEAGEFQAVYRASDQPHYVSPRPVTANPEIETGRQLIQFVRGCFCPTQVRHLCPEHLYYGENVLIRTPEEIIGEVISLPHKRIHLLDDDVAALPDYYTELFRRLQDYHRQWVVSASDRLFERPRLIRLLAKAGTKVVYLNESFLLGRLRRAVDNPRLAHQLYSRVKSLQASKMLVGARIVLPAVPSLPVDYDRIAAMLKQIDLDFIEPRFLSPDGKLTRVVYQPMVTACEPAWLKYRFYSMEMILNRIARRPRRVGVFTTAAYLLPYSAAYRQNFFEGLPWP